VGSTPAASTNYFGGLAQKTPLKTVSEPEFKGLPPSSFTKSQTVLFQSLKLPVDFFPKGLFFALYRNILGIADSGIHSILVIPNGPQNMVSLVPEALQI
jgi:hypothetical protein